MHLRGVVLSFISMISVSLTTDESRDLMSFKIPSKPISMVWNIYLQDVSGRWRMLYPEFRTPKTKESGKKKFSSDNRELDRFEQLDKYFGASAKTRSEANERQKSEVQEDTIKRAKFVPLRNIIKEPTYCQEDEKMDANGICRLVIPTT